MSKLLLISVIVGMIAIPVCVSREPDPVRGLKKALLYTLACNAVYYLALRFVLPRL